MEGKNVKDDHNSRDHRSGSTNQSQSIDLQIKVLRRALARIQELQGEYQFTHTESRTTVSFCQD